MCEGENREKNVYECDSSALWENKCENGLRLYGRSNDWSKILIVEMTKIWCFRLKRGKFVSYTFH